MTSQFYDNLTIGMITCKNDETINIKEIENINSSIAYKY